MYEFAVQMRWADLDPLHHVNNVAYLDYAADARAVLVDADVVADDARVVGQSIRFLQPLQLSRRPVIVRSTLSGSALTQEISSGDGSVTVAEVTTVYGDRETSPARTDVPGVPIYIRRSDLDVDGGVRPTTFFELFQEARTMSLSPRPGSPGVSGFVVGASSVTFRASVPWRPAPYTAAVWVSRIGTASVEVGCELADNGTALADATTTLVGFDAVTQTSRPFDDDERAALRLLLRE